MFYVMMTMDKLKNWSCKQFLVFFSFIYYYTCRRIRNSYKFCIVIYCGEEKGWAIDVVLLRTLFSYFLYIALVSRVRIITLYTAIVSTVLHARESTHANGISSVTKSGIITFDLGNFMSCYNV